MTLTLAVASQKGGVGKTSLVQNLGAELARTGQRVLMVDFDPQANLTEGWGIDLAEPRPTVYQALATPITAFDARIALRDTLSLIPANLDLAGAESDYHAAIDRNYRLDKALTAIKAKFVFDFILIDCPPSLGFFTVNALFAADSVLEPIEAQPYAYSALDQLGRVIEEVQKLRNGQPAIFGYVLTKVKPTNLSRQIVDLSRQRFDKAVFETVIPVNEKIAESVLDGQDVATFAPNATGTEAYRQLAAEVLARAAT